MNMNLKTLLRKGEILMARPKSENVQINISIPAEWKKELENLARIYSVEEGEKFRRWMMVRFAQHGISATELYS